MVAVCWDVSWQRMPWVGLLTLAWPLTPCRLHQSLCPDELKHFIVQSVSGCAVFGVLLWMKNVRCVLCDRFTKHVARAFSQAAVTQTQMDTLCLWHNFCTVGVNSACIFDGQTSTEKSSFVLAR